MTILTQLSANTLALLAGLLGLLVGSFLNVVIHRLPKLIERDWHDDCRALRGEALDPREPFNLVQPSSHCPHCKHVIRPWENIPLLSYALLRGRCAQCRQAISIRYPIVELITGILSAAVAAHFGPSIATIGALLLLWSLIALTGIDLDTQLLPDSITLPLAWLGLLLNLRGTYSDLHSAVIGAVIGYLVLWSVFWAFKLATGKEGMGYGDFKLLAAIGAWVGYQMLPLVILLSSLVGAIVGISLMIFRGQGRDVPIPFGPYLATAGFIALVWGKPLTHAYLGLMAF